MTPRRERHVFVAAAVALWMFFVVQAAHAPVLLDDWFQLRYWRDHELGASALWEYGRYNYIHYNPRIGEVFLAIVDSSRAIHLVATPLVQLAALVTTFVIAFGRWPRHSLHDLQLLLVVQVMIWLVIPISGIIYFYRPIATNYLWAFTCTLALFVPYRLALAGDAPPRRAWLAPIMVALGWIAGMCNEHTGPTAMVAMAGFVYVAWRRRRLHAWMVSGMIGLYVGYPMLVLAPGQSIRYAGLAMRATPTKLLAGRGISGCLDIVGDFVYESRLGIALFAAALVRYVATYWRRGEPLPPLPRAMLVTAAILAAAAIAIVATLFVSPTTTDRVFYASGVLLVAALAVCVEHLLAERGVRRLVVVACLLLFAFHAVRFVDTYVAVKAENDERLAILDATPRGSVAQVPLYRHAERTRWHLGDDFVMHPWLAQYVAGELYDLADARVAGTGEQPMATFHLVREDNPPLELRQVVDLLGVRVPTYRQWQRDPASRSAFVAHLAPLPGHHLERAAIRVVGLPFDDPRPIVAVEWTAHGFAFVDGSPHDESGDHFIRVRAESVPARVESFYIVGCGNAERVALVPDAAGPLLPIDERMCRGVFTALACEPRRCWVAGWY